MPINTRIRHSTIIIGISYSLSDRILLFLNMFHYCSWVPACFIETGFEPTASLYTCWKRTLLHTWRAYCIIFFNFFMFAWPQEKNWRDCCLNFKSKLVSCSIMHFVTHEFRIYKLSCVSSSMHFVFINYHKFRRPCVSHLGTSCSQIFTIEF